MCKRVLWLAASWLLVVPLSAGAQQPRDITPEERAEAYYEFMLGRHLQSEGDVEAALNALRRAAEADGESGDVLAELAALYARQNQVDEAVRTADAALAKDPKNLDAHQLLGLIYANRVERASPGGTPAEDAKLAVSHLEQGRDPYAPDLRMDLTLARLYLATDAAPKAIALLTELIEDEGGFTQAEILLADAYEQAGRRGDAIKALEESIGLAERPSSQALTRLAELYEAERRWADAAETYERAAARSPRNTGLRRRAATALIEAGQRARARDLLRELTTADPDDGTSLYLLSDVELQLGDLDASEAAARQLMKAEPNGLRGAYALAQVYGERGQHRRVIDTLEPAVAAGRSRDDVSRGQVAGLLARIAVAYLAMGDIDRAIASYRDARAVTPDDLGLEMRLIQAYLGAGRLADAMSAVREAEQRHPEDLNLSRLEAEILGRRGDVEEGLTVLRRALAAHESEPMAHVVLSNFYAEHQRVDEAVRVLEAAEARFPENTFVLFQLGAVLERGRRFEAAERKFREVIEREPENAAALNYLGYMLADRGERLEESVTLLLKALEIDPNNGAYLDSLGWAYYKLDRLDLAEPHLRQASDQMQTNSVVQDHLGDLLFKLGQLDDAIAAWERALAGDRDSIDPEAIEQKIRDARRRGRP